MVGPGINPRSRRLWQACSEIAGVAGVRPMEALRHEWGTGELKNPSNERGRLLYCCQEIRVQGEESFSNFYK